MKRALISVHQKQGIGAVAQRLAAAGWEILSTGGTARFLRDAGVAVVDVASVTGFPEILDGRVKTLHPLVHGPILARDTVEHRRQLEEIGAGKIDLVMVNFYPFAEALTGKARGVDFMMENVDIGGPAMVRAAAKNFPATVVVVDEADYGPVSEALAGVGDIPLEWRRRLAQKAFAYTSFYDSLVAGYLAEGEESLPPFFSLSGRHERSLRYGENPHQRGALYIRDERSPLAGLQPLQGKELSFNNILDLGMAYELCQSFVPGDPFVAIIKHQNPCGAAQAATTAEAYCRALAGDPKSAYGGIVGFACAVDEETAEAMRKDFFEVVVAPDFSEEALRIFAKKKNMRLVRLANGYCEPWDVKVVPGGFVLQDRDNLTPDPASFILKAGRPLSAGEQADAAFGWKIIKHVKSNAIVIVRDRALLGVGAGQMSRVDSVDIALKKCLQPPSGALLVSDAFFPFADSIEAASLHGIAAAVEPGGSVRDDEVIAAAQKAGISLLFTSVRHFRH
jgi:phosphoribosylaminoimidazolecarboxamide formyltransferase / IMP cyclohydrolase